MRAISEERAVLGAAALPAESGHPLAHRTRLLLEGPVAPALLRLAAPNVLVMLLQAAVTTLDAVFVGWLGGSCPGRGLAGLPARDADADHVGGRHEWGRGLGGGPRPRGGRREEADALVIHALLIALGMAALFTAGALWAGPAVL